MQFGFCGRSVSVPLSLTMLQAEQLLGMKADELAEIRESGAWCQAWVRCKSSPVLVEEFG